MTPHNKSYMRIGAESKVSNLLLLPINQQLHDIEEWCETAILNRGNALFERALKLCAYSGA